MDDRGDRKLPIWVTELSWPAAEGKTKQAGDFATTDAGQAQRLESGLKLLAADRKELRIGRVYWYSWLTVEGASADAFRLVRPAPPARGPADRRAGADGLPAHGQAPAGLREARGRRAGLPLVAVRFPGRGGRLGGLRRCPFAGAGSAPAVRVPGRPHRVLDAAARLRAVRGRRDRLERDRGRDGRRVHARERAGARARADRRPPRRRRAGAGSRGRARPGSPALVLGRGAGRAAVGARRPERAPRGWSCRRSARSRARRGGSRCATATCSARSRWTRRARRAR